MKEAHDCKRLVENNREAALAAEGLADEKARNETVSLASAAVLYRKDVLANLQKRGQ